MSAPVRVLQVFGALNRGGSETMIMNLYRCIDRSKVQFDFVKHTSEKNAYDEEIISLGGRIYAAPNFKVFNYFCYKKWWRKFFEKHPEYKVVHGHHFIIASVIFDVAHQFGLRTIGHSHALKTPIVSLKYLFRRHFLYRLSQTSDYRFACSQDAGKWIFKKDAFSVLANSIDSSKYVYSEEKRKRVVSEFSLQDKVIIGNIGRLTLQKNQSFVIDVFFEIKKKVPNAVLMIVGCGELELKLKKKVNSLCLQESVVFTGPRSDVHLLLSAMDVMIFPSLSEGLGIVAIEAQAAGLYTFCSDTIPQEVQITDLVEFISLKKNASEWASLIIPKICNYKRKNTQCEIVRAGYDVHDSANKMTSFYLNVHKNIKF